MSQFRIVIRLSRARRATVHRTSTSTSSTCIRSTQPTAKIQSGPFHDRRRPAENVTGVKQRRRIHGVFLSGGGGGGSSGSGGGGVGVGGVQRHLRGKGGVIGGGS